MEQIRHRRRRRGRLARDHRFGPALVSSSVPPPGARNPVAQDLFEPRIQSVGNHAKILPGGRTVVGAVINQLLGLLLAKKRSSGHRSETAASSPGADSQGGGAVGPDDLNGSDIRCRDGFSCYTAPMTYNAILTIECLVEDFGWDAVVDVLMKEAATASDERLNEVEARRIFDFRVL